MRIVLSLIVLLAVASVTPSRPPEPQQAPPPAQAPPVRQFVSVPAQAPEVAPCCPCCVGERCTCGAKCDCVCESKAKADDCACGCTDGKPCACPVCPQYLTGAKAKGKAPLTYSQRCASALKTGIPLVVGVKCEPPKSRAFTSVRIDDDAFFGVFGAAVIVAVPKDGLLLRLDMTPGRSAKDVTDAVERARRPVAAASPFVSAPSAGCADGSCTVPSFNYGPPLPMMFGDGYGAGFDGGACIGDS